MDSNEHFSENEEAVRANSALSNIVFPIDILTWQSIDWVAFF